MTKWGAGMTKWGARMTRCDGGRLVGVCRAPAQGAHKGHPYGGFGGWWDAGRDVVDGIAIDVPTRGVGAWIPACAGMTNWGAGQREAARVGGSRILAQQMSSYKSDQEGFSS